MRGWLDAPEAAKRMDMHVETFRRAVREDRLVLRVTKEKVEGNSGFVRHLYNEEDVNMRAEQKTLRAQRENSK